jgi:hypothetical protein
VGVYSWQMGHITFSSTSVNKERSASVGSGGGRGRGGAVIWKSAGVPQSSILPHSCSEVAACCGGEVESFREDSGEECRLFVEVWQVRVLARP